MILGPGNGVSDLSVTVMDYGCICRANVENLIGGKGIVVIVVSVSGLLCKGSFRT